jgi:hypothetical protein
MHHLWISNTTNIPLNYVARHGTYAAHMKQMTLSQHST